MLKFTYQEIFSLGIFSSILLVFLAFLFGEGDGLSGVTCILLCSIMALLLLPLSSKNVTECAIGGVLSLLTIINVFPRAIAIVFKPLDLDMPFGILVSLNHVNYVLLYIFCSMVAFVFGVNISLRFSKRLINFQESHWEILANFKFVDFAISFAVFLFFHYLVSIKFNYSIFNIDPSIRNNIYFQICAVVFAPYMGLLLTVTFLVSKRLCGINVIVPSLIVFFIFILEQMLSGSRSGTITIFIAAMLGYIVVGRFKERFSVFTLIVILSAFASMAVFEYGSLARADFMAGRYVAPIQTSSSMLSRLYAPLDTAILSIKLDGDPVLREKYLTLNYAFKSALNIVTPGTVFDDSLFNVSQAWPFIFGLRDADVLKNKYYYESFIWTSFGLFYSIFGWVSLVVFLLAGAVAAFGCTLIAQTSGLIRLTMEVWFLNMVAAFLFMMSLDDWLAMSVFYLINATLFMVFCYGVKLARNLLFAPLKCV